MGFFEGKTTEVADPLSPAQDLVYGAVQWQRNLVQICRICHFVQLRGNRRGERVGSPLPQASVSASKIHPQPRWSAKHDGADSITFHNKA